MKALKEWYYSRERREQYLLLICGSFLSLFLLHSLAYEPLSIAFSQTQEKLIQLQQDVAWMRKASLQIKALSPEQVKTPSLSSNESLQTLINRSARTASLSDVIKYTIPKGANQFRLRLEDAKFSHLVQWLYTIRTQHGINVYYSDINKAAGSGQVNSNITLNRLP